MPYALLGAYFPEETSKSTVGAMRAVIVSQPGGVECLQLAELAVPEPDVDQVRIRVKAATVNPVDVATRSGALSKAGFIATWPLALGWDVAGVVDRIGPGIGDIGVGDSVIGVRTLLSAPVGAQAEFVVLDRGAYTPAPRDATPAQAATLPLNGLTAMQALNLAALDPSATLLVTGGAGAVGGFLVELGTVRGLHVVAVAAPKDEELVRALGARDFVPLGGDLARAVRAIVPGGVDAAVDAAVVGIAAHEAVRDGGAFVAVAAGAAPPPLRGTRVENVWIRADREQLAELVALTDAGRLTLRVAEMLPLQQVARAHERLAAGGLRGRIVLCP